MSQQQIQNINIKNIIPGPAKRLKRRTKKIVPVYSKKIAKGDEMEKSVIKTETGGLPTYIFTPQKKFLSLGDLSTKSDDTSTDKLINLLKGAIPVIAEGAKKLALPAPEQKFMLGDADKDLIDDMIGERLRESEPFVKEFIRQEIRPQAPPLSKSDVQKENERIRKEIEDRKASRTGTPFTSAPATPLREEEEEEGKPPASFPSVQKPPEPSMYDTKIEREFTVTNLKDKLKTFKAENKSDIYKFIDDQKVAGGLRKGKPKEAKDWNTSLLKQFGTLIGIELKGSNKAFLQKAILDKLEPPKKGAGTDNGDDGLYNDQIEKIMKKRIKNFVPVVASDKVNDLLQYVNKGDKFFSAVINTEPSESFGRHWRCIVIDNRDDYPSAEYFDSLAENAKPDDALLSVMRKICKRMNAEKYFKFKYNMLRRQSFNTSNCSYHVMKFIEDRHNGVPFEDASGWSDYVSRQKGNGYEAIDDSQDGEGDLANYQNKIKKLFKSYL